MLLRLRSWAIVRTTAPTQPLALHEANLQIRPDKQPNLIRPQKMHNVGAALLIYINEARLRTENPTPATL